MADPEVQTVVGVTPDLFDECLDFFYAEFFPRERLAKASGLDRLMYTGARHIYSQWLAEGLSVALVDPGDGTALRPRSVVGVALNFRVSSEDPEFDYSFMCRENRVIWDFTNTFEGPEIYDVFQDTGATAGVEICMLGVAQRMEGRGLAQRLVAATLDLAGRRGLGFVKSNPSAAATFRVFEKLGFRLVTRRAMLEYWPGRDDDEPQPFPHAGPDDYSGLVVKTLTPQNV